MLWSLDSISTCLLWKFHSGKNLKLAPILYNNLILQCTTFKSVIGSDIQKGDLMDHKIRSVNSFSTINSRQTYYSSDFQKQIYLISTDGELLWQGNQDNVFNIATNGEGKLFIFNDRSVSEYSLDRNLINTIQS